MTTAGTPPLHGVRVVEFAGLAPVTMAGMLLADLGADVVRIDRLRHNADDETNTLRRGRRSACFDLKHPDGLAAARQLAAGADVVIEAYRPGVMERLGLGPDDVHALNPRVVYGRLTGWGQDGPYSQGAGHDITYLALTGALFPIGPAGAPPAPPINYVADMGGGAMFLLLGLLAALHARDRDGIGQVVDAAMLDGVPLLACSMFRSVQQGVWSEQRGANVLDGGAPFYRCYECAGGGFIAVGAIEPEFYAAFVRGLGFDPAELPAQMDREHWPVTSERFAARVRERSRDEWEAVFAGTDACVAPVLTPSEAPRHPQVAARAAFFERDGWPQPSPAPKLTRTPLAPGNPPPRRGAHTTELLAELGRTDDEIAALLAGGAAHQAASS